MRLLIFVSMMLLLPITVFGLRYLQVQVLTSGDMSQTEVDGAGIDVTQMNNISVQAAWTGAPVGNLKLQISNDLVRSCAGVNAACNVVNWSDYSGSQTAVSGAGNFAWNITLAGYKWIRVVYLKTSGTGSINAVIVGKGY